MFSGEVGLFGLSPAGCSCCLGIHGGEAPAVHREGGGHDPLVVGGDTVELLVFHLGDQSVAAKLGDLTGGPRGSAPGFCLGRWWAGMESFAQVVVAEPSSPSRWPAGHLRPLPSVRPSRACPATFRRGLGRVRPHRGGRTLPPRIAPAARRSCRGPPAPACESSICALRAFADSLPTSPSPTCSAKRRAELELRIL